MFGVRLRSRDLHTDICVVVILKINRLEIKAEETNRLAAWFTLEEQWYVVRHGIWKRVEELRKHE